MSLYFGNLCFSGWPGRIHPAAISGIDSETQSVSVEWFENDETKGKEVSTVSNPVTMGRFNWNSSLATVN